MYRGEIQNDSGGGNYNRSLDFSPSNSGGGGNDRFESCNLSVGAGIGRCEEDAYNCCGLYGRGDDSNSDGNASDSDLEGGSVPTNPALYEKAKAIVNKSYPKHSAYRSGAYVKKYKEMGGEYRDDGERKLERWFKEDWKDVGNKEYPTYRPTKRITKDTPLTADEIDPENLSEQINRKQKIRGEENLKPFVGKGKTFTKEQLTKIILDKNKVIADLEENAYGEGYYDDVKFAIGGMDELKGGAPKVKPTQTPNPSTRPPPPQLPQTGVSVSGTQTPVTGNRTDENPGPMFPGNIATSIPPAQIQIVFKAMEQADAVAKRELPEGQNADLQRVKYKRAFLACPCISAIPVLQNVVRNYGLLDDAVLLQTNIERQRLISEQAPLITARVIDRVETVEGDVTAVMNTIQTQTEEVAKKLRGGGPKQELKPLPADPSRPTRPQPALPLRPLQPLPSPPQPPITGVSGVQRPVSDAGAVVGMPVYRADVGPPPANPISEADRKIIFDALLQANLAGNYAEALAGPRVSERIQRAEYYSGFFRSLNRAGESHISQYLNNAPGGPATTESLYTAVFNDDDRQRFLESIVYTIALGIRDVTGMNFAAVLAGIKRNTEKDEATLKKKMSGRGGAEPAAKPSPVAAVAEALKPVREELQKGIGSLIYGEETDPKKQKKGLLGISEEQKEESQKKVNENIVKPIMKNIVVPLATGAIDLKDQIFNPGEYEKRFDEGKKKRKIATEQTQGIFRNKEGVIMKKPKGEYNGEDLIATEKEEKDSYVRIPNPLYKVASPSSRDLELAGIKLWEPVNKLRSGNMGQTLREIQNDEFLFVPEKDVKSIYAELSKYASGVKDQELATGFEELGWNKADMNAFAKLGEDFSSFTPQEKSDYLGVKGVMEKQQLKNALAKVEKDIKDEEAKASPDQARLAKMRDAKVKVIKRQEDKMKEAQAAFKANYYGSGRITDFLKGLFSRKSKPSYEPGQTFRPIKSSPYAGMSGLGAVGGGPIMSRDNRVAPVPQPARVSAVQYAPAAPAAPAAEVGQVVACSPEHNAIILNALIQANRIGQDSSWEVMRLGMAGQQNAFERGYIDTFRNSIEGWGQTQLGQFFYSNRGSRILRQLASLGEQPRINLVRELAPEVCLAVVRSSIDDDLDLRVVMRRIVNAADRTEDSLRRYGQGEGGAGSDDEDSESDVEEVQVIEVKVGKETYLVDAAVEGALPVGNYKSAIKNLFFQIRRIYNPKTKEELGVLSDAKWKKVAMVVLKKEEEEQKANLKKLGFERDADTDGSSLSSKGGGAKPVEMKQGDYYKEHKNIVKLLKNTGKSLLSEAKDQQDEASAMAKKMDAPDPFDREEELVGEGGAIEFTLAAAGKALFNPTGDTSHAGRQTFTPDYDAYGDTIEQGRQNAFALAKSMYNQQQAIEIPGFDMIQDDTSLRFYIKDDEDVVMVGIRGTDVKSYTDLYTWAVIGAKQDFRMTTRFQDDLQKLLLFQKEYPTNEFYYVAVGSSLAGSIADRFLDMGLISEAITYNPSIEKKYILDDDIHNHRVYLDTDPLFILMGQYAPNTEIRVNASKMTFFNPSKEKDYLIKSHSIFPVYNRAFEGGGMMGAGKTYTIEEWKAIFDAKLEKKREQIEARAAKKKDTAKAKRDRAKVRRDERAEIPDLETPFRPSKVMKATPPKAPEPEPEMEDVEMTRYKVDGEDYFVDDPREGVAFDDRMVMDMDSNELGTLADFREIAKKVLAKEKPKAPRKPRLKVVAAPASARVELREELVEEQPRNPAGEFAVAAVARPQKSLGLPTFTEGQKRMIQNLKRSEMTVAQKAKLLARSGIAGKLMEMLAMAPSDSSQGVKELKAIVGKQQKRVEGEKMRAFGLPGDIEEIFRKQEAGMINYIANVMNKKDVGKKIDELLVKVIPTFVRCGFGCLNLVAECMRDDPFDVYLAESRGDTCDAQGKDKEKHLTLMMNMTKADEDYPSSVSFWTPETRPFTTMNFSSKEHEGFFLPELTQRCLMRLEGIDGISTMRSDTRNAGMGFKRRNQFEVFFEGVSEEKRFTAAIKEQYSSKIKSEIVPKIMAIAAELKPKMEERGELMRKNVEASLTPAQRKLLEEHNKNKNP